MSLSPDPAFLITFEKIKSRIVVNQSVDDADSDDIDVFFKRITYEERLYYYYDQKDGRALRIVVASAETLFAPLNCLPILIFCFSSFPLLFPLILSFFLEVCESYPPF